MEKSVKETMSSPFFQTTRVSSCQFVRAKGGQAYAVCFPYKKTGWKAPNSWNNQRRSAEVESMSRTAHRPVPVCHSGMAKKPLTAYTPNAYRSRLPSADVVMPYKNASVVEIGDRSSYNPKSTFRTTNRANLAVHNPHGFVSNQGIVAETTKWTKKRLQD